MHERLEDRIRDFLAGNLESLERAKARKVALLASRTTFALSIPLFCAWVRPHTARRFKVRSCGARPNDRLRKCGSFHPISLSRSQLPWLRTSAAVISPFNWSPPHSGSQVKSSPARRRPYAAALG